VLLKSEFEPSGRTYGSRRLQRQLDHQGIRVGLHRVLGLMEELQITAIWKRQFMNTTDSRHNLPVFENSLKQTFLVSKKLDHYKTSSEGAFSTGYHSAKRP